MGLKRRTGTSTPSRMRLASPIAASLASIKLVVLDVDGVLTDGRLIYGPEGESLKSFHVRDGMAIATLRQCGIKVAIISGRDSAPLRTRLAELNVERSVLGCRDKATALKALQTELSLAPEQTLCMGDDLADIPMRSFAAIFAAPSDAADEVREVADWLTTRRGGHGAVREVADALCPLARTERSEETGFHVVIPSRWASSRLPGKPLADIGGKPMIAHVVARARESGAESVTVATDDKRIAQACARLNVDVVLTATDHESGTDRIAEVAKKRGFSGREIIVNLQGDEPAMLPLLVAAVANNLSTNRWASIATLATPIVDAPTVFSPSVVKVVIARSGKALLFSRAPIPWCRDVFGSPPVASLPTSLPRGVPFLRHLGLYAYRGDVLAQLAAASPTLVEKAESLEQLRALDLGLDIHVGIVKKAPPEGVDTEADLERMRAHLPPPG